MSLSFKGCFCAALIIFGNLLGSECVLDVKSETLNRYPVQPVYPFLHGVFGSGGNYGETVWHERNPSHPRLGDQYFYWSQESGTLEIDIEGEMRQLGFAKRTQANSIYPAYQIGQMLLHRNGTVFLTLELHMRENSPGQNSLVMKKVGVWNKKTGFKVLNASTIEHVNLVKFSHDTVFITGQDIEQNETIAVIQSIDGHYPWEPKADTIKKPVMQKIPETTPWDTLPYGMHSGRLHILKQLLKKTKDSIEQKAIMVMIEAEVTNLFDLLQYDVKRAESLIANAKSKGKEDTKAKEVHAKAKKHIAALLGYFNTLPKASKSRIDAIQLPSKDWVP